MPDELWSRPVRRVLVIAREHIGDLVNTTPCLRALQARFPGAEITVDVGKSAAPVLENFPGIHQLWIRERHEGLKGKLAYIGKIRRGRFDLAVIFDDSSRFVLECFLARVPIRVGIFRKRFAGLFTQKVDYLRDRHDVFDPFGELMELLEVPVKEPRPALHPSEQDIAAAEAAIRDCDRGEGLIGLNPATVRPYNRWPSERWAELARVLLEAGYRPILLGPPGDREAHRQIAQSALGTLDWTGGFTILQLYEVVRRLDALVSVDTGTAHLAGAVGTPVAVLYGVTEPHRFRPYGEKFVAVRHESKTLPPLDAAVVLEVVRTLMNPAS